MKNNDVVIRWGATRILLIAEAAGNIERKVGNGNFVPENSIHILGQT